MASGSGDDEKNRWPLGKNRYIGVSEFRNKMRVDIREFYLNDNGEKKPGKKGISLSLEEWQKLKDLIEDIDKAIKGSSDGSDSE